MVAAGFWLRNLFRMEYRVSALCSNIKIVSWRAVSSKERLDKMYRAHVIYITGISISQKRFNSRLNRDDLYLSTIYKEEKILPNGIGCLLYEH